MRVLYAGLQTDEGVVMSVRNVFRINNFDLIRLIAALQVAVHHTMRYLEVDGTDSMLYAFTSYFPGVPVFFFVSGFLITKSYESNSVIKEYAQNRLLRIYPALLLCVFLSLFGVYLTGYFAESGYSIKELAFWIVGQVTFYQFYNPEFMRGFGVGVLNGSLWTISVELQFYIVVPILYWVFGLAKQKHRNAKILILILFFMVFQIAKYAIKEEYGDETAFKLFAATFVSWIWMFLFGAFFQMNFAFFHKMLSGKVLIAMPVYLVIAYLTTKYLGWSMGNEVNPILYIILACVVFSFAYSFPTLGTKLLRKNDISYGVYIYHMPVANMLIHYEYTGKMQYVVIAIIATILLAGLSWFTIEKNSIKLKKHPLNPLNKASKIT